MSLLMDALKKAEQEKKKAAEGLKRSGVGEPEGGLGEPPAGSPARPAYASPAPQNDQRLSPSDDPAEASRLPPAGAGTRLSLEISEPSLEAKRVDAGRTPGAVEPLPPHDTEATLPSRRAISASLKDYFESSQSLERSRSEPSGEIPRGASRETPPFTRVSADTVFSATRTTAMPRSVSAGMLLILILSIVLGGIWIWAELGVGGGSPQTVAALVPEPVPQAPVQASLPAEDRPVEEGPALQDAGAETAAGVTSSGIGGTEEAAQELAAGATAGVAGATPEGTEVEDTPEVAERAAPNPAPWVVESSAIKITRGRSVAVVDPRISEAYRAYQRGELGRADRLYRAVLSQEPDQRDALLGLAALALRSGRSAEAGRYYRRLLEVDPRDSGAYAALANLPGGEGASESRIKLLLDQSPEAAHLNFSLGNLYARQGRWAEAQDAYFKAYSKAPRDADYAVNLAVSLDRLGQSQPAVRYYHQALDLAARSPANFDAALVRSRLQALARTGGSD